MIYTGSVYRLVIQRIINSAAKPVSVKYRIKSEIRTQTNWRSWTHRVDTEKETYWTPKPRNKQKTEHLKQNTNTKQWIITESQMGNRGFKMPCAKKWNTALMPVPMLFLSENGKWHLHFLFKCIFFQITELLPAAFVFMLSFSLLSFQKLKFKFKIFYNAFSPQQNKCHWLVKYLRSAVAFFEYPFFLPRNKDKVDMLQPYERTTLSLVEVFAILLHCSFRS